MNDIPVRKMAFEIPADFDLVFLDDDPENGLHVCRCMVHASLSVGTWAIFHYLKWVGRMKKVLKNADLEAFATYDNSAAKARRNAVNSKPFRRGIGNWLATYLPWHTPRNISLPNNFNQTRQRFTDKAKSVS